MEYLEVCRGSTPLLEVPLVGRAIEIGRSWRCDVVVDDPEVQAHHWLVAPRGGTVVAYPVAQGTAPSGLPLQVPLGRSMALGLEHRVRRRLASDGVAEAVPEYGTAPLSSAVHGAPGQVHLMVGRGPEARFMSLDGRPLHLGRAAQNDVVLVDNAVSGRHCRLERGATRFAVRDLGSRNGTYVDGVKVERAELRVGSTLRVGRTDLRLVGNDDEGADSGPVMVAESSAMMRVLAEVSRLAQVPWPVLLRGETGAGKEGLALALHHKGPRASGPFVAINGGALAPQLVESELFGHERGAFTGATVQHRGVFEQAHRGTLFLDEVGELSLPVQARLLRVLEGGEVRRVGGQGVATVDVRLVCATHRDLQAMVAQGAFRADLYYRIARLIVDVPPLRARPEDIVALAERFLAEMAVNLGPRSLSPEARDRLLTHGFPGNVRELRNLLGMAAMASPGPEVGLQAIEDALAKLGPGQLNRPSPEALHEVVAAHGGNLSAAARALGWPRSTLRDRLAVRGTRGPEALRS